VCCCSRRWWAALAPCCVGGRRAVSPSQIVGKLEPPVLLSFPLIYRSTATLLDDKICRRCSIFPQFPVLSAPPSSCGPPRNAVATSHHRNRLRRRLPPRLCPHGHRGSSPWPARFSAPLVILFIVLALLQLHDAHRLHSFTSNAQVTRGTVTSPPVHATARAIIASYLAPPRLWFNQAAHRHCGELLMLPEPFD
jgi:hypothetical protein